MTKDVQGDANMAAALSGDLSIAGANKAQIEAMGGEVDTDLDDFKPTAADRGDTLEPAEKSDKKDEPAGEKDGEEAEDDAKDDDDEESEVKDDEAEESEESEEELAKKDAKDADDEESEVKDDEAEESEEEPAKKDADEKLTKKGDEQRIPKSRFDEVNARRKAAEEELAALKAAQKAKEEGAAKKFDFDAAEERYGQLLLDGKVKEANAVRKEIRAAERAEWEAETKQTSESTVTEREVKRELDTLVTKFEGEYAELNKESESYSEDMVDEVQSFFTGYLRTREDLTAGQAFTLAVDNVVKIYGLKKAGAAPTVEEKDPPTENNNVRVKEKKDTKKKIDAAKKAPKDPGKAGTSGADKGTSEVDLENMTDEEFNALPEATLKRLRGDLA